MNNPVTPYGYTQDGKVYLKGYMDFPDREIGVVKESEEASLQYFIKRFDLAKDKVEILKKAVLESPNKGSYLMKLIHMRTYLGEFDGLGDFPILFAELDEMEDNIRDYIQHNRHKNLEIKQGLLQEAEALKNSTNWNITTKKLKEIKLKWIKTGSAFKEEEEPMNVVFDEALDLFFGRRKAYLDEKNGIINERVARYEELIFAMKRLNAEEPDAVPKAKSLQSDWKTIGAIPKKRFGLLYKTFKHELDIFFNKQKKKSDFLRLVGGKEPIDQKKDIVEFIEKLVASDDEINIDQIKEIQNHWKNLGKTRFPIDREYNTRFKIACNEIFESYFLTKTARWKYESFDEKTRFEQLKIKIRLIKESIKKDETDLSLLNDTSNFKKVGASADPEKDVNLEKINQINKLKTKNRILRKLQDQLLANY